MNGCCENGLKTDDRLTARPRRPACDGRRTIAVCSTAAVDGNTAAADYTDTVNVTVTY